MEKAEKEFSQALESSTSIGEGLLQGFLAVADVGISAASFGLTGAMAGGSTGAMASGLIGAMAGGLAGSRSPAISPAEQGGQATSVDANPSQASLQDEEGFKILKKTKEDLDRLNIKEIFPKEGEVDWKILQEKKLLELVMGRNDMNKKSHEVNKEGMNAEFYKGGIQVENISFYFQFSKVQNMLDYLLYNLILNTKYFLLCVVETEFFPRKNRKILCRFQKANRDKRKQEHS